MSFSFQTTHADKESAKAAVAAEMDKVVASQESHAAERDSVIAHASNLIDAIHQGEGQDIVVNVSGSVSWLGTDQHATWAIYSTVNVYQSPRVEAETPAPVDEAPIDVRA